MQRMDLPDCALRRALTGGAIAVIIAAGVAGRGRGSGSSTAPSKDRAVSRQGP